MARVNKDFETIVLEQYFLHISKFESFRRQLHRYGFETQIVKKNKSRGKVYKCSNPYFVRGIKPDAALLYSVMEEKAKSKKAKKMEAESQSSTHTISAAASSHLHPSSLGDDGSSLAGII